MLKLEEATGEQLEVEGHALVKMVAEDMLISFQSCDPQDTAWLVAAWFKRQAEDA
jgi:hypothetical protein